MASKIEIVNLALTHLGVKVLSSLTETSEGARRVAVVYDFALDEALRARDWTFATKFSTLVELDEDAIEWTYCYTRPNNCVRVRRILNAVTDPKAPPAKFREMMSPDTSVRSIVTDIEGAIAEITYRVTDTTQYDASFNMAFSYRLAAELAKTLTGDANLGITMMNIFERLNAEAGRLNAGGDQPNEVSTSPFLDAR